MIWKQVCTHNTLLYTVHTFNGWQKYHFVKKANICNTAPNYSNTGDFLYSQIIKDRITVGKWFRVTMLKLTSKGHNNDRNRQKTIAKEQNNNKQKTKDKSR